MGWQSYVIPFDTESERKRILDACHEHNTVPRERWDEVGEKLIMVQEKNVLRPYANKSFGPTSQKVILCGNGGGRSSTYYWFGNRKILVSPHRKSMEWHFSQRDVLEIDLETMKSFDPKADQYAAAAAERAKNAEEKRAKKTLARSAKLLRKF